MKKIISTIIFLAVMSMFTVAPAVAATSTITQKTGKIWCEKSSTAGDFANYLILAKGKKTAKKPTKK